MTDEETGGGDYRDEQFQQTAADELCQQTKEELSDIRGPFH